MNKDKLGQYSLNLGVIALILAFYKVFFGPDLTSMIICLIISALAILFGVITFINHSENKRPAIKGILCGLLVFVLIGSILLSGIFKFGEKYYSGIRSLKANFIGNTNSITVRYCNLQECFSEYTYNVSTGKFTKQDSPYKLDSYSLSRDGKKALYTDGSKYEKNIFLMNADGSGKRQLTHSIDKDTILISNHFSEFYGCTITKLKVKTNANPSFSPDGKRVIFVRYTAIDESPVNVIPSDGDIYETNIETGSERKLTNDHFQSVYPKYLSDGNHIIFLKGRDIINMDVNTREAIPIETHSVVDHDPAISFDDKIAFTAETDKNPLQKQDVFIKIDEKIKRLTDMRATIGKPEISADGNWILFPEFRLSQKFHVNEVFFWIMKSDGTNLKEIVPPKD